MYSKKLTRHIKRAFGDTDIDAVIQRLEEGFDQLPSEVQDTIKPLLGLSSFVSTVDRAYLEYEERLEMASRNIDISSRELSESNQKLADLNTSINTMIDALEEGYFLINNEGKCEGIYSNICTKIFGASPTGKHIVDLIHVPEDEHEIIDQWISLIFAGRLRLEDLSDLGPKNFTNDKNQLFSLHYRLIIEDDQVKNLVVVASDKTAESKAILRADEKANEGRTIVKLIESRDLFRNFIATCMDTLTWIGQAKGSECEWARIRLELHTLKAGASTFMMTEMEECLHEHEKYVKKAMESGKLPNLSPRQLSQDVYIKMQKFIKTFQVVLGDSDRWMDEVVLDRKTLLRLVEQGKKQNIDSWFLNRLMAETVGTDIHEVFQSYNATAAVAAERLGKLIAPVRIEGEPFKIPMDPYKSIFSGVTHLIRNAVDHGIESNIDRIAKGKPEQGQITIRYGKCDKESCWWFEVEDDGRGINCEALRKKLVQTRGPEAENMTDEMLLSDLFGLSVSTKAGADTTSGMGVGLEAIRASVESLGGTCKVQSTFGKGTCFQFIIPMLHWLGGVQNTSEAA